MAPATLALMDDYRINQLTKEIVSARLKELENPHAAAAALVRRTLEVALRGLEAGRAAESRIVEEACQGGMVALLLNDQSLPEGAVAILEAVSALAARLNLDQPEMLRSALRGIADVRRFVTPEVLSELRSAIEASFQGAGEVFEGFAREPASE
ncbi:MAG: hypothetical protein KGO96_09065 [Elusimicrobia bacterium]|nr:hypothetical protein [Elusimicrobiota bacterium]MDE2426041.1 hypothetical protein [Elusimicrobiota bacterium]